MTAPRLFAFVSVVWLGSALVGCCCGPLSCRYGEPGCPCAAPVQADCGCGGPSAHAMTGQAAAGCQHCGHAPLAAHRPLHPGLHHGLFQHEPVPSKQHYDYVSPTPKYHPVPTHPVFEPQPEDPPPHLLAGPAPRRRLLHEGHLLHPHHGGQAPHHGQPTPARPISGERSSPSPQPPAE